ncbi:MAG: hypothetical protein ACRDOH_21380 [Streptosporangiaceae bacterium]
MPGISETARPASGSRTGRKLLGGQVHEHSDRGAGPRRVRAAGGDLPGRQGAAHTARPRTEHFAPLFVALGAGGSDLDRPRQVIEGFRGGLAEGSVQLG